jgi:hypothetical protein
MSVGQEPRKRYSYTFRSQPKDAAGMEGTDPQTLFSIRDTILLLTGDCDVVERPDGPFCQKHSTPVKPGKSKCEYLASRFAANDSEEKSKAQVQQYVNEVLGVKDPKSIKRLTGV